MLQSNFIFFFIISSLAIFGQTEDSLFKERMTRIDQDIEMYKKKLKSEKTENYKNYFRFELIDSIFDDIKNNEIQKLYDNSDEIMKKVQTKEDISKYFNAVNSYYGKIINFEKETYSIKNLLASKMTGMSSYKVNFEKVKAKVLLTFTIVDSSNFKIQSLQITQDENTQIDKFDSICKPTLKYLITKNYPELYNSTSSRFQKYTPIGKFEEYVNLIKEIEFTKLKQFQSQIGISDGKLMLNIIYEIGESKGYLSLIFVENKNSFQLEGLNYEPNNK